MEQGIARVISFGLGGHGIEVDRGEGYGSCYISGYDSPESFERELAAGHKTSYPPLAGVAVIDKRAALEADYGLAMKSPLCNAKLADGAVDRFADICPEPADSLIVQAFANGDGQQQRLAAMAVAAALGSFGGLDEVAPDRYVAWWREHGARIGRMDATGLAIQWDDQR